MPGARQQPEDRDESDRWEKAKAEQEAAEELARKAHEEAERARREDP